MEGSYFPEDKDLAHKIMMDLSNSDLVKICSANKRLHDVCNNYPDFWRNKSKTTVNMPRNINRKIVVGKITI